MNLLPAHVVTRRSPQRGAAIVEFALVAPLFFLLLLGAMEFGRLLYLWNTVQEVTRNAARQAVVANFAPSTIATIQNSAVFSADAGPGVFSLPAAGEITNARVLIRWLNANGNEVTSKPTPEGNIAECLKEDWQNVVWLSPSPSSDSKCIYFVEVCVSTGSTCSAENAIPYVPMVGLFSYLGAVKIPMSTVRMPAESLGFWPRPAS